jgi:hypothetical protein
MKAEVRWENAARTVIRYTFSDSWDWDDFYGAFGQQEACTPGSTTCALVDFRRVSHIPSDAILHLRGAAQLAENIAGVVIVIATSASALTTFHLFVSMYRSVSGKFRLAASDEEAFAILQMPPQ